MAKDDQEDAFEKLLSATLARDVDFLKFAEAKNAALVTFSSAWLVATSNFLLNPTVNQLFRAGASVALPLFAIAAILAVLSFLPRTLLENFHRDPDQSKSLLYFGHAAQFSPAAYKERVRERYYPPERHTATTNYLDELSVQIVVNSQITRRKLRLFNAGGYAVLLAFTALAIPAIIYFWSAIQPHLGAVKWP